MKKAVLLVLTGSLMALPAHAGQAIAKIMPAPMPACGMKENVTISVNFNIRATSFAEAKQKFDQKIQQLNDFAKQQNIGKFEMNSMNYNISAQANYEGGIPEPGYQLNGSASYLLSSSDDAFKLGEFLSQQKFQVNVNVNKYRGGGMCNNGMVQ